MRLRLTLEHRPNQVLPINYGYLISSWIYRTLGNADKAFTQQLHEHGYDFGGKKYKFFSFSALRPKWYNVDTRQATFTLSKSPTTLELSFHVDQAVQHFVMGLFKDQQFELSSGRFHANFEVSGIEMLAAPTFENTMRFRAQTPICIGRNMEDREHAHYASPEEEGYAELLLQNLLRKQQALKPELVGGEKGGLDLDFPYEFRLLSKPKSKLVAIKGIKVRGYLFDFDLMAPEGLMEVGYFGGFGEKNSSAGFGMVKKLK
jgi:CRISPR-associated endoribonuclease Cas6